MTTNGVAFLKDSDGLTSQALNAGGRQLKIKPITTSANAFPGRLIGLKAQKPEAIFKTLSR